MQTFLPYNNFEECAKCLDSKRLGKQRIEAFQILNILLERTNTQGWINHPAVLMWKGYEESLKYYFNMMLKEWIGRGYKNNLDFEKIDMEKLKFPSWLGNEELHASHRSNLLRKDYDFYIKYNWTEPDNMEYYWPTKEN